MKRPELLAPAGTLASAEAALSQGADAVYAGVGRLNLRAHAPNFTNDELPELLALAQTLQRKVYVTLNIMPDESMLDEIRVLLDFFATSRALPDAIIVSDPGVVRVCRQYLPRVALHLSTQTGVFNSESLAFWRDYGVQRAILPRELTLGQIGALTDKKIMETEIFIHGAMCVSVSGRCLLGAYLAQRHPNYGDCPQPCRLRYRIAASPGGSVSESWLDAEESDRGVYLLNSRDLCTISILPEIMASGVDSLKIEGRNKGIHYVASVVKTYRSALDTCFDDPGAFSVKPEWIEELESVEHRPYTTGFYAGDLQLQEVFSVKAHSGYRVIGIVKGVLGNGNPVVDVKNSFDPGDAIQVLPVRQKRKSYDLHIGTLLDLSEREVGRALSNRLVVIAGNRTLEPGDILRKSLGG